MGYLLIFLFDGAYHVEVLLLLSYLEGFKEHDKAIERLPTLDILFCKRPLANH
jgi:hypothetical protein